MSGADVTVAALSDYYVKRFNLANRDAEYKKNRVTLGRLNRNTEKLRQGDGFYETIRIADAWSDSPDFATGMSNFQIDTTMRWLVTTPYTQYGRVTFDGLMLQRNNVGSIIDNKAATVEGVSNNMLDSLEFQLWNTVSARAQISVLGGTAAVRVLTLTNADDVYSCPVNMVFYGSTTNTGAGTDHVDVYKVSSIDPMNTQITATRISGSSNDLAANDFIFAVGSKDAYMPGIATFIPAADPTDTLYGVARTGGGPAVSGWRFPFVGSISETIQRSFAKMGKYVNRSAGNYAACLSVDDWLLLSLEQQGQVIRDPVASQTFGVEVLQVRTPFGNVPCISIPQLKSGRGWLIDWTTFVLYTIGNLPHVIDDDGRVMQRLAPGNPSGNNLNGDGVEMRFRIWKAMLCLAPIANATFLTA